ncbi:roadblock/LC7 domain-containing protein [Deinococcus yavapaiensis]|uniref:Roadblock/LAMTOR2 domain-containing protein n=1 Tax=Deinococcus yavapaiensis KR-236 TaxID=694435 RepID=A0A318S3C9_9DEIO|nr:roadblock/LC7 domain-containing protein [Deinococcus yavapaiensis]PYE50957.1 hypothetical protein DES52_11624 [Deinococcus yavapaiensis KR-236]
MTATTSKQTALNDALSALRSTLPELKGVIIATSDGLPVAQTMGAGVDANRVAAMAATALGLGKRINDTLAAGTLTELSVSGTEGQVFLYSCGRGVLAVVTPAVMNLGLLHMEARDTAKVIAMVL